MGEYKNMNEGIEQVDLKSVCFNGALLSLALIDTGVCLNSSKLNVGFNGF